MRLTTVFAAVLLCLTMLWKAEEAAAQPLSLPSADGLETAQETPPHTLLLPDALAQQGRTPSGLRGLGDLEQLEEQELQSGQSGIADWLTRTLQGRVGTSSLFGEETARRLHFFEAGVSDNIGMVGYGFKVSYSEQYIKYVEELIDPAGNPDDPPERTSIFYSNSDTVEDAFLRFNYGPLTISGGIQTIVWGQFQGFSPVDFMLPFRSASLSIGFSKVANRLPQQVYTLSWFLQPQIEMQLYHFPKYELDELSEQIFFRTAEVRVSNDSRSDSYTVPPPERPTKARQAARLMFYPTWATFGFTYYKGWDYFDEDFSTLKDVSTYQGFGGTAEEYYYEEVNRSIPRITARGFEFAKRVGSYTWKVERVEREGIQDNFFWPSVKTDASGTQREQAAAAFRDWVIDENEGKLYVPLISSFSALGFETENERRIFNFLVYLIDDSINAHGQRGRELHNAVSNSSEDDTPTVFPAFQYGYRGKGDNNAVTGFAIGVVGPGFGASIYHTRTIQEVLRLVTSYESVSYFNDDNLGSEFKYRPKEGATNGPRLTVIYSF